MSDPTSERGFWYGRGTTPNNTLGEDPLYHAELRKWTTQSLGGPDVVAVGRIYNDAKKRWPDGHAIVTSPLLCGVIKTGGIVETHNTRYLLSGPKGDLKALLQQGRDLMANGERRQLVAAVERLFDLLPAAWGLTDEEFERVAGFPERWMWEWRNHYRSPLDEELAVARRLMSFHEVLGFIGAGGNSYSKWWRRVWRSNSIIGERSPLQAVLEDGDRALDLIESHLRAFAQ